MDGNTGHHDGRAYPASTNPTTTAPDQTGTFVGGQFHHSEDPEKTAVNDGPIAATPGKKEVAVDDDDEDEDMDALIDDLESQDGIIDDEEEVKTEAGGARPVAEELLQTSTTHGLTEAEVLTRRKKFGLNQMKEEKPNLILKFLGYFVGPIQFVMEVGATLILRFEILQS